MRFENPKTAIQTMIEETVEKIEFLLTGIFLIATYMIPYDKKFSELYSKIYNSRNLMIEMILSIF